jgi:hypothetical protein
MNAMQYPTPLARIHALSQRLAWCCLALLWSMPILVVAYWLWADTADLAARSSLMAMPVAHPLLLWQRLAGATVSLVPLGLLLTGLWHARCCFLRFAEGGFFELGNIERLRQFAAWTFASVAAAIASEPILSVLLTFYNAPGHRQVSIGFSSEHLFALVAAAMVWLIAAVMTHACRLAEENAQFI